MRVVVTVGWTASYADPIRLSAGEALRLSGREDNWDGHRWLWAEAGGRAGWIPDSLAAQAGDGWRAARDYSAMELSCAAGEVLEVLEATHGWHLCRNEAGVEGWVPDRNLSPL